MANDKKFLDNDGLLYFWTLLKQKFAAKTHEHSEYANKNSFSKINGKNSNGLTVAINADSTEDSFTLAAGENVDLNIVGDTITISSENTEYTLPAAGTALGGVKTGGDVTISEGIITVKDDSHNHNYAGSETPGGSANSAKKLETPRAIDGVAFDGTSEISHYAVCDTSSSTPSKTVSLDGFKLVEGAKIAIKFTEGSGTTSTTTLDVNSTGVKNVKYGGGNIRTLSPGRIYEFIYDGINYELIGELDTTVHESAYMNPADFSMEYMDVDQGAVSMAGFLVDYDSFIDSEEDDPKPWNYTYDKGSTSKPVYFDGGVPKEIDYTIEKSVPSDAKFTDTVYTHPVSGVVASTYRCVTVNAQGHITTGTNPTTLAGYGITDACTATEVDTKISQAIAGAGHITREMVDTNTYKTLDEFLASQGTENVIYMYPEDSDSAENCYAEFMWINGKYERTGSTAVSLEGYVQHTDVITNSDIDNILLT